jgi:AcrR family transcriptional regulator
MGDGGAVPKAQVTRRVILEAAAALFRQKGYAEVSLREIAQAANIKTGSLYYHFDGKESLVEAILTLGTQGALAAARQAVEALGAGADPADKLHAAFAAHARFLLEEQDFASANLKILPQVPPAVRERHVRQDRQLGEFVAGIIEEIAAAGRLAPGIDRTLLRMLCFGALNWSISWFDPNGRSPTEIADQLMMIVRQGALAPPP